MTDITVAGQLYTLDEVPYDAVTITNTYTEGALVIASSTQLQIMRNSTLSHIIMEAGTSDSPTILLIGDLGESQTHGGDIRFVRETTRDLPCIKVGRYCKIIIQHSNIVFFGSGDLYNQESTLQVDLLNSSILARSSNLIATTKSLEVNGLVNIKNCIFKGYSTFFYASNPPTTNTGNVLIPNLASSSFGHLFNNSSTLVVENLDIPRARIGDRTSVDFVNCRVEDFRMRVTSTDSRQIRFKNSFKAVVSGAEGLTSYLINMEKTERMIGGMNMVTEQDFTQTVGSEPEIPFFWCTWNFDTPYTSVQPLRNLLDQGYGNSITKGLPNATQGQPWSDGVSPNAIRQLKYKVRAVGYKYATLIVGDEVVNDSSPSIVPDGGSMSTIVTTIPLTLEETYTGIETINGIESFQHLYDEFHRTTMRDSSVDDDDMDALTLIDGVLTIKPSHVLTLNSGLSATQPVEVTHNTISVRLAPDTVLASSKECWRVDGTMPYNILPFITATYKEDDTLYVTVQANIPSNATAVRCYFWLASITNPSLSQITNSPFGTAIPLVIGEEYAICLDGQNMFRSDTQIIHATEQLRSVEFDLRDYAESDKLILDTSVALTPTQQQVANMFQFNANTSIMYIRLPSGWTNNVRWDVATSTWTFLGRDFYPVAYKIAELQASTNASTPVTIQVQRDGIVLSASSPVTFLQYPTNVDCTIDVAQLRIRQIGDSIRTYPFLTQTSGAIINELPAEEWDGEIEEDDGAVLSNFGLHSGFIF